MAISVLAWAAKSEMVSKRLRRKGRNGKTLHFVGACRGFQLCSGNGNASTYGHILHAIIHLQAHGGLP